MGGGRGDARGSEPRGREPPRRDPGWDGRDSGLRGPGGYGRDPGNPGGSGRDAGTGAPTRRLPVHARGLRSDAARGAGGRRDAYRRRNPQRPPGGWGSLQGGLGVCIIVASAAVGAIVTMVGRSAPGFLLGLFVVAGTVAAALAVRPRAGRMIFPVPVLSYLVAALISGVVDNHAADSSRTALAIAAAQWIANGFFTMALATVLAVAVTAARWYLWRRGRRAAGDPGWPVPAAGTPRRPRHGGETGGTGAWGDARPRGTDPRPGPRPGSGPYNFSSGA